MKKTVSLFISLVFVLFVLSACNHKAENSLFHYSQLNSKAEESSFHSSEDPVKLETPFLDFSQQDVESILVSSMPKSADYERTIRSNDKIAKVINYMNSMELAADFPEKPNYYVGMTLVIEFCFSDHSKHIVYSFGNMFLRIDDKPWLRLQAKEAIQLEEMLLN